jgi:tRNA-specific 2-thiouridylase
MHMENTNSGSKKKLVFVGLSGGVDSSVAAYLLKKDGYDVVGVHLRCWNVDGCDVREAEDARRVANKLDIPFYVFDMEKEYEAKVVEYMIQGYRNGITPNPDVACNREIKFGLFMDRAMEMGADYVATGHYVKIAKSGDGFSLFEAKDKNKDQSYFLWTLTQRQLKRCLFPLGDYIKPEVRTIAKEAGLPTAAKKDSQGICFIGKVTIADFLSKYIPEEKGNVLNVKGEKVGEHNGAQFYTIGQRHLGVNLRHPHIGVPGPKDTRPVYVSDKDVRTNTLVVAEGEDNPVLYRNEVDLSDVNVINRKSDMSDKGGVPVMARVRYRQRLSEATLTTGSDGTSRLAFNHPQKFVALGQSAVFYSKEGEMLGGGTIIGSA